MQSDELTHLDDLVHLFGEGLTVQHHELRPKQLPSLRQPS
jgi:hypothetical protein